MPPTRPRKKDDETTIGWVTVTYRSVFMAIAGVLVLAAVIAYFIYPDATKRLLAKGTNALSTMVGNPATTNKNAKPAGDQKASFTMLDGTVKVKKKNSNSWVAAAYDLPLEKGDVVQTGPEGMAKIIFADQTNYTVKQDSLIVVEENSTNAAQQTRVAVNVTTGTVDLTTATYAQGSKSQVIVAGATATLAPDSQAVVRNDPRSDQHEILVKKGSGEVNRAGEIVSLSNFEKVSFKADATQMTKDREVGPPILIDPSNMMPIFASGTGQVKFSWTPLDNVKAYHIRVSRNPYFTQMVLDRRIPQPELTVAGIPEGAYYWTVQSVDERGRESVESERNKFSVVPKNNDDGLSLELEPFVQHGRIIEVRGKTDTTARVMVNGGEVPFISPDGKFRYLTPPLPNGENIITVTAQNTRGGVSTQTKRVVIQ
ncbi:MAG TPA: hypothetical protein VM056_02230 [Terriglobales bacterium]|nr:hypothetical protein [Terriglobales bacterium]